VHWLALSALPAYVYVTVGRLSVCLSVCLSQHLTAAASLLLWARVGRRYRSIAARSAVNSAAWRAAANAGSATLSADVGSWTQTCYCFLVYLEERSGTAPEPYEGMLLRVQNALCRRCLNKINK